MSAQQKAGYERWLRSLCADGHRLVACGNGLYRCEFCRYEMRLIKGGADAAL